MGEIGSLKKKMSLQEKRIKKLELAVYEEDVEKEVSDDDVLILGAFGF